MTRAPTTATIEPIVSYLLGFCQLFYPNDCIHHEYRTITHIPSKLSTQGSLIPSLNPKLGICLDILIDKPRCYCS